MDFNMLCLAGISLLPLILGLFLLVIAIKDWLEYHKSNDWVTSTGSVGSTRVTVHRSSKGGTHYGVSISYEYTVMGNKYQSNRYSFGSDDIRLGIRQKAEAWALQYPPGKQVAIFHNPANPSEAVFQKKYDTSNAVLGVFMSLLGGWMFLTAIFKLVASWL